MIEFLHSHSISFMEYFYPIEILGCEDETVFVLFHWRCSVALEIVLLSSRFELRQNAKETYNIFGSKFVIREGASSPSR